MASRDKKAEILRHMLGLTDFAGQIPGVFYRDYFCANPGDPVLEEMAVDGLVKRYSERGGYHWYTTTDAGKRAAMGSFRALRYPKKRRRYYAWLRLSESNPDLTFREYLTSPYYAEHRRNA